MYVYWVTECVTLHLPSQQLGFLEFFPIPPAPVLYILFKPHQGSTIYKNRVFGRVLKLARSWWWLPFLPLISTLITLPPLTGCTPRGASAAGAGTAPRMAQHSLFPSKKPHPSVAHPFSTAKTTVFSQISLAWDKSCRLLTLTFWSPLTEHLMDYQRDPVRLPYITLSPQ